jgi:TatD DNase family protein
VRGSAGTKSPGSLIDSHCHLADEVFEQDLGDVVARASSAGLGSALCIVSADEPVEIERARRVAEAWPAVRFAAGVHPHRAGAYASRPEDAARVALEAAEATGAIAIGEIGLDYHYDFSPRDVQHAVFVAQVHAALESDRPVVIHTREASTDTFRVLAEAGRGRLRGVMHCFTGTADEAAQALALGFHISFSGILTFPKASELREVARAIPDDRLLVETDAPFLAPVPYRGRRNEPAWVAATVAALAACRGVAVDAMTAVVARNFDALFRVR